MNIVLTKIHAAASAQFCGRYSFARQLALGCALGCAVLSAAQAGERDRDRDAPRNPPPQVQPAPREGGRNGGPPPQSRMGEQGRADVRQFDPRAYDARVEEQRRQQQDQNADAPHRSGRLTPDERRDLRRQINEVGMDLYPPKQRR